MTKNTPQSNKDAATKAVLDRIASGAPFTYAQLTELVVAHGAHEGHDRIADRTIQSWRRKGSIAFVREGRNVIWSLTELGRAQITAIDPA